MKIEISNTLSRIVQATPKEEGWLRSFLTYEKGDFRYVSKENRIHSLLDISGRFPSGFIPNIRRAHADAITTPDLLKPAVLPGSTLEFIDIRLQPPQVDEAADVEWIRHHPAAKARGFDPIAHLIEAYEKCVRLRRGVIWIPTGGGKGELIAALTRAWPLAKILVLVSENVSQLAERIERRCQIPVGRCGEGETELGERVTVGSYQTLLRRLRANNTGVIDFLNRVEVLLVDEVHMLPGDGFYEVAMKTPNAPVRIGLSATPSDRTDTKNLLVTGCIGPIIYRVFPRELIDLGIISEPIIQLVPCVQTSQYQNWETVYDDLVVSSDQRNDTLVNIVQTTSKPAFLFVERERHGAILKHKLQQAGINCEFVWGAVPHKRRRELVASIVRGDLPALVCSGVFRQGLDVPTLASVVNAAGRASTTWTLQRLGRGSRTDVDTAKYEFQYWDILDHGQRWLEKHTHTRVAAFRQEGYIPKIVTGLEAPDADGNIPDFRNEKSGIEIHQQEKQATDDAIFELTGQRHIRKRLPR